MNTRLALCAALLCAALTAGAGLSMAAPMYGEPQPGAQKGLGGIGIPVSWSNPNTVLYTCNNPNGFVVLHIVPRNPQGIQPLTFTMNITGGAASTFTTSSVTIGNTLTVPISQVVQGSMGQSIVVTPLTTTTGTIVFDLLGYEGL